VLGRLKRETPELDVVVVNDGSTDATAEIAHQAGAVVLSLPFNLGIGGALRTGFRYAVEGGYERAVQVDADGQHDPTQIRTLLAALDAADLVIGSRFAHDIITYEAGRTRRGAMRVLQTVVRVLSGRDFTDTSSGFRAFNRSVLEFFALHYPSEYMESVEALIAAHYEGFRITEIPVQMHDRSGGAPSNRRLKLAYHYVRVLTQLFVTARRHPSRSTP